MKRLTLLIALLPASALADACAVQRPGWDGSPVDALSEAAILFMTPLSLLTLAFTIVALRFRSQWMGLAAVLAWTGLISVFTMYDPAGTRQLAMVEGCIGAPTLFIAAVVVICAGTVIYTMPRKADG